MLSNLKKCFKNIKVNASCCNSANCCNDDMIDDVEEVVEDIIEGVEDAIGFVVDVVEDVKDIIEDIDDGIDKVKDVKGNVGRVIDNMRHLDIAQQINITNSPVVIHTHRSLATIP